ncbi:MAG: twin-arginine translocase subunit TatC [Nitrososphaeria archaeon]|nr:twin-arginine translocase subunit TatC [Nitrososphaeria archaeon]MDW8021341.1 twin-arginine translocase subunit TatC [Nitrososphaerota archaeon]
MPDEEKKKGEKPRNMKEMTLLEHLIELRDRLKVCLITIGVLTLLMLVFPVQLTSLEELLYMYKPLVSFILDWINSLVRPQALELFAGTITAPLEIYFIASLIFALIFSSPVVGYEIFKYVDPALYPHERRMIYPFLAAFLGLFIAGLLFGLYVITPFTFKAMLIFFPFTGVTLPAISIMDFYMTVLVVTIATGVVFTTPAVLVLLVRVGLMSTKTIERNRKWIYGAMYIVAAIITPDGGMFTNLILLGVFVGLLEGGILVAKRYEKRAETEVEKAAVEEDTCKFCKEPLGGRTFCPRCGKSQI